jgi:hypothetical protein
VEKRKDGLEFFGIKNSGGERERVVVVVVVDICGWWKRKK